MTNSKNKEIPVLDQSDTDRDDIDYYFHHFCWYLFHPSRMKQC